MIFSATWIYRITAIPGSYYARENNWHKMQQACLKFLISTKFSTTGSEKGSYTCIAMQNVSLHFRGAFSLSFEGDSHTQKKPLILKKQNMVWIIKLLVRTWKNQESSFLQFRRTANGDKARCKHHGPLFWIPHAKANQGRFSPVLAKHPVNSMQC